MDKSKKFLATKDGQRPRTFTLLELEAMGKDQGKENSYNGWVISDLPETPSELKPKTEKIPLPKDGPKKAGKGKSEKITPVKTKKDEKDPGNSEAATKGDGADPNGTKESDPTQSGEGNPKAD